MWYIAILFDNPSSCLGMSSTSPRNSNGQTVETYGMVYVDHRYITYPLEQSEANGPVCLFASGAEMQSFVQVQNYCGTEETLERQSRSTLKIPRYLLTELLGSVELAFKKLYGTLNGRLWDCRCVTNDSGRVSTECHHQDAAIRADSSDQTSGRPLFVWSQILHCSVNNAFFHGGIGCCCCIVCLRTKE